jgi:hypothetical protein
LSRILLPKEKKSARREAYSRGLLRFGDLDYGNSEQPSGTAKIVAHSVRLDCAKRIHLSGTAETLARFPLSCLKAEILHFKRRKIFPKSLKIFLKSI